MNNIKAFIVVGILIGVLFVPFISIWALNTLFLLGIPYTFKTWLASLILSAMFGKASVTVNK